MNVNVPLGAGFCMAALFFFWIMAVIPSIALTELASRIKRRGEHLSLPAFFCKHSGYACGYCGNMAAESYCTVNYWQYFNTENEVITLIFWNFDSFKMK